MEKQIRTLKKYMLDNEPALQYFQNILEGGNILSEKLLKDNDFDKGIFYTFLPDDAVVDYLYRFKYGGIIPAIPCGNEKCYTSDGLEFIPKQVFTTTSETCDFIEKYIQKKMKKKCYLSCVFEEVIQTPSDPHVGLYNTHGVLFEDKIYYLIKPKQTTFDIILESIEESDAMYHLLGILTETNTDNFSQGNKLSIENIEQFVLDTKMIIVGAYDGEGYLFWEKGG